MNKNSFVASKKKNIFHALAFMILIVASAIGSAYIGQHYFPHIHLHDETVKLNSFDQILHQQLSISSQQDVQLAKIEETYQKQLKYFSEKLKLINMELANAVKEEKIFGPRIDKAIEENHTTLGELQKATMKHLFEMQTVLSPEQSEKMNSVIADALYH